MSRKCQARGCQVEVSPGVYMCSPHWRMVPEDLKAEVARTYTPAQEQGRLPTHEHFAAMMAAIHAVAALQGTTRRRVPAPAGPSLFGDGGGEAS